MTDEPKFDGGDESRVQALMAEVERYEKAWAKDNTCGICPYRTAIQAENERLREALEQWNAECKRLRLIIREHGLSDGYA